METTCSFVFKEHDFLSNHWKEHLLYGNESSRMMVDRVPAGGSNGGAFRQHIQQWGKPGVEQVECIVSHSNMQATFRPSESGSIVSLDFDCSLRNIERSTETHFALLLEQNNNLYISKNTLVAKRERWSTFSMHNLKRADFKKIVTSPNNVREELPNFTFLGGEIRLGYATICTTTEAQDEAVSGIEFWRVTVYHENAEATNQSMRLLQLEHNNNILMQELSDMHEHVDKTRRDYASQLASVHTLRDELKNAEARLIQERVFATQQSERSKDLCMQVYELQARLAEAEGEVHRVEQEGEQIRHMMEEMAIESDARESQDQEVGRLRMLLTAQQGEAVDAIGRAENTIVCLEEEIQNKDAEILQLRSENARLAAAHSDFEKRYELIKEKQKTMKNKQTQIQDANETLSHSLSVTKENSSKLEELLRMEQVRREEIERQLVATSEDMRNELQSLRSTMDDEVALERNLRIQLESNFRKERSTIEEQYRSEKVRTEEQVRAERLSFLQREAELLEEKRNLATSLQAATTKSSLIEQRLSNQLSSVSALHKSEVERISILEAELKTERDNREILESQLNQDEEDWEVVDDQ